MHGASHSSYDVDRLYVSRNGGGRGHVIIDKTIQSVEDIIKKAWWKTEYGDQKPYRQRMHQNKNRQKTKMERKTIV